jgi:hypothetical protein
MVVPTGKPPDGASLVMTGDSSAISDAAAEPSEILVRLAVASAVTFAGALIVGSVLSRIVIL